MDRTPMQRWLDMRAETDSPPSVQVPQKFIDELNQFREIRSREEFLELTRLKLGPERGCMKHDVALGRGRTLDLDVAFGRLNVYLPVALKQRNEKTLTKLYSNINRVLNNQPIEDVTAVLAITLGKAFDYWHKKQPLRKQRKAA